MIFLRLIIFQLIVLIATGHAAAQISSDKNSESEQLIAKFNVLVARGQLERYRYDNALSPWVPYLTQPFDEGIAEEKLDQYLQHQNNGECGLATVMEVAGFFKLYPQLADILLVKEVNFDFGIYVMLDTGRGSGRCWALRNIDEAITAAFNSDDSYSQTQKTIATIITNRQPNYINPIHRLMMIAICADYTPAIKDALRFERAHRGFLTLSELTYFEGRLDYKNIPHFTLLRSNLNSKPSNSKKLKSDMFATNFLADPEKITNFPLTWQVECGRTQYWRFAQM